jgi:hypothetical protein
MKRKRPAVHNPFWAIASSSAAVLLLLLSALQAGLMDTGYGNLAEALLGALFAATCLAVFFALALAVIPALRAIPVSALALLTSALLSLWLLFANDPGELLTLALDRNNWGLPALPDALSLTSLIVIVLAGAMLIALLSVQSAGVFASFSRPLQVAAVTASLVLVAVAVTAIAQLSGNGRDPYPDDGAAPSLNAQATDLADPSTPGQFDFETLSYGAGDNRRRPEFGRDRDLESRTVDARKILPQWKDFKQEMREAYWGFGLADAPLNGRVWAPTDSGPHPLVLIVHGNHGMEDYSDDGYAYLGELLASRGFIAVSVDQNFINGSWSGDFRGKEMPARAWLLLEHLKLWHDWNDREGHPFYQRVDTRNIALIGHSRGGEAVAIAHGYNRLPYFPDDASLRFDYQFQIRSLVAIAQVDQRYSRRMELEDVNFFTIHGSYDSDEPAYHGLRQMNRIRFSGDEYFIKAGAYLHGANHGQFNTGWGRYDYSPPGAWTLNTAPIIPGEEQRQAAKVTISAFLEATLHGDHRYLPLLKDPRAGSQWLPRRTLVAQFTDSSFVPIADFEEDLDLTTGSLPGIVIDAPDLAVWREEELMHRDKRKQGSNALVVGWRDRAAALSITLPENAGLAKNRSLVLSLTGSTERLPGDKASALDADDIPTIADLSLELVDSRGQNAKLRVSDYAQLIPPVRVQYLKNAASNKESYHSLWEPVLQFVEIPLEAFEAAVPGFVLADSQTLNLRFDQADKGILIIDNIGTIGRGNSGAEKSEDTRE